ncbi:alpha/beta-hydrolase [Aspergillus pseudoustus]|uniref:Alpha/beta-hydrolase n=1 Tax=Aspergillus pseudoustus TaxID=1810923 RepID=A0ABR4JP97_9EURO
MPNFDIFYKPISAPTIGENGYRGFLSFTEILPKGWKYANSSKPLPTDILVEHDVEVRVRDGCKLYADVYRPVNSSRDNPVPAILSWSPFGKKFNGMHFLQSMTPYNVGIKDTDLSGLEKFEGPDPATFVPHGFAVVNIDPRGVGDSDGLIHIMGEQEGEDGYDAIEYLAKLEWCNGRIGMAGNSHLAVVQWFIAQLQPPSLKAIAPWEACSDLFREQFVRGGVYSGAFYDHITSAMFRGRQGMEDFGEMYRRDPLANPYWNSKRPDITKIQVPTYLTASFNSFLHTMGSIRGYMDIQHAQKWIRFSPFQEWHDQWAVDACQKDLISFFTRYLHNVHNGWEEQTPRVRMSILRFGQMDAISNVPEDDFPLPRTVYKSFYLAKNSLLQHKVPDGDNFVTHISKDPTSSSIFTLVFKQRTVLTGLPKAVLYMSCPGSDDMDVYVMLRKLDTSGKPMHCLNVPWSSIGPDSFEEIPEKKATDLLVYKGPVGILRASHREVDNHRSLHENYPFHPHSTPQKLQPSEVVKLEIGIFATSIEFEAGEALQLQISGQLLQDASFDAIRDETRNHHNQGLHHVHFGTKYPSHIVLPFV